MQKEYLQPFLDGVESVYKAYFGIKVKDSDVDIESKLEKEKDIVIVIGIKGALTGMVLLCISQEDGTRLGNHKLMKDKLIEKEEEWGELHQSMFQEFTNQVTGKVLNLYEKIGKECKMSIPRFVPSEEKIGFKEETIRYEIKSEVATLVVKIHID